MKICDNNVSLSEGLTIHIKEQCRQIAMSEEGSTLQESGDSFVLQVSAIGLVDNRQQVERHLMFG